MSDHDQITESKPAGPKREAQKRRSAGVDATARIGKMFEREAPHAPEAEEALLASLLLDPSFFGEVLPVCPSGDRFYDAARAAVYDAIKELYDRRVSVDIPQLIQVLREREQLELVGGSESLVRLAEVVASPVNAIHYARIIAEKFRLRQLISAAGEMLYDAYHAGRTDLDEAREIVDRAEMAVFEIAQAEQTSDAEKLEVLVHRELERIEQAEGQGITGIPSGYQDLDDLLSGFQPGEMIILAARPSMGKTALSLNLAEQIAMGGCTPFAPPKGEKVGVGFFSLEMSRGSVTQRLISARSGVDAHKMRTGAVTARDWKKIHEACADLYEAPLYVDDTPGMTVLTLRARARRLRAMKDVRVLVVDYLQLLSAPGSARESRQNEVSTISRQIKSLARELNVPVLCLAQLNRGAEQREGNRPRMSDLRESGSIEQDADVVMLLHREAYYHKDDEEWLNDPDNEHKLNLTELIIAKQRNGPTGTVKFTFDAATTRFKAYDFRNSYGDDGGGAAYRAPMDDPMPADNGGGPRTGSAFGNRPKTGPPTDHRDGGGPTKFDSGFDGGFDEEPPF